MNDSSYIFDSTNGCPRCDAMDGDHAEEPERPHPLCDCLIAKKEDYACYTIEIELDGEPDVRVLDKERGIVEWEASFIGVIHCHEDEQSHPASTTVISPNVAPEDEDDIDDMIEVLTELALEEILETAQGLCTCELSS